MTDIVERVECSVILTLNDGREIDISLVNVGLTDSLTNYITSLDIHESTNTQNSMPVGVVSSNTMKIVLNSNDRSLFPENRESPYYGLMDNTATVKVSLKDVDGVVNFNTYYVINWVSNVSSRNPNQVTIECADLLAIVQKNTVPMGIILEQMSTKEAFIYMIQELNKQLESKYKINYNYSDIVFDVFDKVEFDNLEAGNMGDWLNTVSQCTLTNIYVTRDNLLKTDYCLDDKARDSVATLSDAINITSASVDSGGLVNYTGIKTNYVTNTINLMSELASFSGLLVEPGYTDFTDLDLGNKVYAINVIRLVSDTTLPLKVSKLVYDKRKCSVQVYNQSSEDVNCTIVVFGQAMKENIMSMTKTKGTSNEVLEVTNKLLLPSYVRKYTEGLLKLVGLRNSSLSVTGFINPRIKLGDTVYVDVEKSIKTSGYYKVIDLQWKISNTIKCTAKLVQVIV